MEIGLGGPCKIGLARIAPRNVVVSTCQVDRKTGRRAAIENSMAFGPALENRAGSRSEVGCHSFASPVFAT